MLFWFFMLLSDLLIPATMIIFGTLFTRRGAPDRANSLIGYRTRMSALNDITWVFAHHYIGRIWKITGWALLPLTLLGFLVLLPTTRNINTIANVGGLICLVQGIPLVGSIIPTELALRRHFHKDGTPKGPEE